VAKIPVAHMALMARIRRRLKGDGQIIRWVSPHNQPELGNYVIVDVSRNVSVERITDLEAYARRHGDLREFEDLEERKESKIAQGSKVLGAIRVAGQIGAARREYADALAKLRRLSPELASAFPAPNALGRDGRAAGPAATKRRQPKTGGK